MKWCPFQFNTCCVCCGSTKNLTVQKNTHFSVDTISNWLSFYLKHSFFLAVKTSNLVTLPQNDSQRCIKDDHLTLKLYVHWNLSSGTDCSKKEGTC